MKLLILIFLAFISSTAYAVKDYYVKDSARSKTVLNMIPSLEGVAILLIDAFLVEDHDMAPKNLGKEIDIMSTILQKANEAHVPVFEFHIQNGDVTNPRLLALSNEKNWISIAKNSYSVFGDPQIHEALSRANINTLIVMGFNQKLCVQESVADAVSLGYKVYTSFDVIQGHRIESDDLVRRFYQKNTVLSSGQSLIDVFFKNY